MIQFCLRLGDKPQACITTTPRNNPALRALLNRSSTVKIHALTTANRANLADDFLEEIEVCYAGTRLGRQEMDGELLTDVAGSLWSFSKLSALQIEAAPPSDRIVVAIDPPITGRKGSDDYGMVICGVTMKGSPQDWQVTVLEDATMSAASPNAWAKAAIAAMDRHGADRLVAEVN